MLSENTKNQQSVQNTEEYITAAAELTKQFLDSGGLCSLIKTLSQILNNPVAIVDTAFKLISYHTENHIDDPVWDKLINTGFSDQEYLIAAEQEEITQRCYEHEGPIILDSKIGKVSRKMLCRIVIQGNVVASLGVLQVSQTFTKTDEAIVDFACKLIAVELEKRGQYFISDSQGHEQLLYDLLTMSSEDRDFLEKRLNVFNICPKYAYYAFCIPIPINRYFTADYIRRDLKLLFPDFHTILLEEKKYLALIIDCKPVSMIYHRQTLFEFLEQNSLHAGLSDSFTSLIDLQYYFRSARLAYKTGVIIHPNEIVFSFEDYRIFIYLAQSHPSLDASTYCHKALEIIRSYDEKNDTELFHTLNVYLTHMGNLKNASEILCIHRNTMRNRIEKIIDLTNLDLEDGNVFFDLEFSYKLLEFESYKTSIGKIDNNNLT